MISIKTQYISLECLAATLSLPQGYLRTLANDHKIPFLKVGRWMRFSEVDVRQALADLANANGKHLQPPVSVSAKEDSDE